MYLVSNIFSRAGGVFGGLETTTRTVPHRRKKTCTQKPRSTDGGRTHLRTDGQQQRVYKSNVLDSASRPD